MREILSIQVGQCGNQISRNFWEIISEEHSINPDGQLTSESEETIRKNEKINCYFAEGPHKRLIPRAVLVDLEPGPLESIRANSKVARLFRPDNIIAGTDGAGNNWAKGFYTDGRDIIDSVMDSIRREVELCECIQGFQLTHSLGGGTGSGLGSLVMTKLKEEYPDRIVNTFSIYPSIRVSDVVVEPYNAMLGLNQLIESSDESFLFDNEALINICSNILKIKSPSYGDLNHLVSQSMGSITASLRYSGMLNCDLRKLAVNLVPFPRLHFFTTSAAPLLSRHASDYFQYNAKELLGQLFDDRYLTCDVSLRDGKILTAACLFRGNISTSEVESSLNNLTKKNASEFVSWIPDNVLSSISNFGVSKKEIRASLIINNSSIQKIFKRESNKYNAMLRRKAFLHYYINEGMDEVEFSETLANISDLCAEYQQYENCAEEENEEGSNNDSTRDEINETCNTKVDKTTKVACKKI